MLFRVHIGPFLLASIWPWCEPRKLFNDRSLVKIKSKFGSLFWWVFFVAALATICRPVSSNIVGSVIIGSIIRQNRIFSFNSARRHVCNGRRHEWVVGITLFRFPIFAVFSFHQFPSRSFFCLLARSLAHTKWVCARDQSHRFALLCAFMLRSGKMKIQTLSKWNGMWLAREDEIQKTTEN